MNKDDKEKRWMAYLDGQLSASEVLDFERGLSARDRARLDGEVRLESAICESFSDGPCCPLALWDNVVARMNQPVQVKAGRWAYWVSRTTVVLAATAAIVFGAPYYESSMGDRGAHAGSQVAIHETSREEFSRGLEATASMADAEAYLRENNINLRLVSDTEDKSTHRHSLEFLGACRGKCPEGTLYELRFWCCNKPVKILVARRGTAGEQLLKGAFECGDAEKSTVVDDYVTAVIGGHNSPALRHLLQPVRGSLT